jgi:hypothetical protein
MGNHYSVQCDSFFFTEGSLLFSASTSAVVSLSKVGTFHNTKKQKWLFVNGCDCCSGIYKLVPRWKKYISLLRDTYRSNDTSSSKLATLEVAVASVCVPSVT